MSRSSHLFRFVMRWSCVNAGGVIRNLRPRWAPTFDVPGATARTALRLPAERGGDLGPAQAQVLDRLARFVGVVDVAPRGADLAPVKHIAESSVRLPGELRLTGANIGVKGYEP